MTSYLRFVVFLVLFAVVGCAVDINPGDFAISVTPNSKDFGDVTIGESVQVSLTVTNNTSESVFINNLEFEGIDYKDFSIITGGIVPLSIDPGQEHEIIVSFSPTAEGNLEASLNIYYDDEEKPFKVDFKGFGIFGDNVVLVPSTLDFENVLIGEYVDYDLTLSNGTDDSITVTTISIEGTNPNDFLIMSGGTTPTDIPAKSTHKITVRFAPTEIGLRDGLLSVEYYGILVPLTSVLTGNGVLASGFSIDPQEYDFGEVGVNSNVDVDFTITNTGNTELIITLTEIIDDTDLEFSITDGEVTSYLSILPGDSHTLTVTFSPISVGLKSAKISITHSGDVDPFVGELSGFGSDKVSISPSSHDFGSVNVGSSSSPFVFTITNPSSSEVSVNDIIFTGPDASAFNYNISGTLPLTIPANGGNLEIEVLFTPTTNGLHTAELSVTTSFDPLPLVAQLTGEGSAIPEFSIVPPAGSTYDYGIITFNSSKPADFTVTNIGSGELILNTISIQNDAEGNFTITSGGGSDISITTGSHVIEVTFSPLSIGPKTATLRIDHNAGGTPCLITLKGEAASVNLTPTAHNFGDVVIGVAQPPTKQFTVTNSTASKVTVSDIRIDGTTDFKVTPSGYYGELGPGQSINLVVSCDPTTLGSLSATLIVDHSFGQLKASLTANGTGTPIIKVTPTSWNFGTLVLRTPAQTKTGTFEIENIGTDELDITSITLEGGTKEAFSFVSGGTSVKLDPGDKHSVVIQFKPLHYGPQTCTLKIAHNCVSPASPFNVPLTGNAIGPDFVLIPDVTSYSIGDGGVGKVKRKGFYIKNGGNQTLTISSIQTSNTSDYNLVHANPMSISPGDIDYFYLDFIPRSTGNIGTTLTINHNSVDSPRTITVTGNGIASPDEIDDDLESDPSSNWGLTGIWDWGVPSNVGPSSAHSGSRCFGTVINGNYTSNQNCYIISKTLDMSAAHSPKMSFYMYMDTYFYASYPQYTSCGWLEISTDGGNSWKRNLNPSPAYTGTATINGSSINVWGGNYGSLYRQWVKINVDLSAAAGKSSVLLAFFFNTGSSSYTRPGWYIDDIEIYDTGLSYPNNLAPQDNDITTKVTTTKYTLKWDCDGATKYDVYFGQTNPPTSKVGSDVTVKQYQVSVAANRKYFWYVVAKTTNSTFKSKVCYFETVTTHPTVLINELETGSVDWIEFYNPSTSDVVYIGGYECTIYSGSSSTADGTFRMPEYLYLKPKETIVFHDGQASSSYTNRVSFDFAWDNSAQGIEVILQKHEYYPNRGVDYMKVNTLASHKPTDLTWSGAATSNRTNWYNWYRNSSTDHNTASDWTVRITTADKDAINPGQ